MSLLIRTLLVLAVAAVVGAPVAADEPKVKKPEPTAEPAKTIIIQIDASKVPPELLKELLKYSKTAEPTKPGTKPDASQPKPDTKPGVKPEKPEDGGKPGPKPVKPDGGKPQPQPETKPVKPDASNPEPIKPGAKPDAGKVAKTITLGDAIGIAEKLTQGTAVKAKREDDDGKVSFEIELIDGKGGKTKVTLDGSGNATKSEKGNEKGEKGNKGDKKK